MVYFAKRPGFTLAEILVTTSIMVVLATAIIIQIRNVSPQQALNTGEDDARSLFVLARSYALNGQLCCSNQLPYGYGIVTTVNGHPDNVLTLYADLNNDHLYSSGDTSLIPLTLQPNVDITKCADAATTVTTGTCDILFSTTGDKQWYFNGAAPTGAWQLTLGYYGTTQTLPLQVYGFGIIE